MQNKKRKKYTKNMTVRMSENDWNFFKKISDDTMVPISRIVRRLVYNYLKQEYDRSRLLRPLGTP